MQLKKKRKKDRIAHLFLEGQKRGFLSLIVLYKYSIISITIKEHHIFPCTLRLPKIIFFLVSFSQKQKKKKTCFKFVLV